MNCKKVLVVFGVALISLFFSETTLAFIGNQESGETKNKREEMKNNSQGRGFCSRIADMDPEKNGKFKEKGNYLRNKVQNRIREIKEKREQEKRNLDRLRAKTDGWRSNSFAKLREQAVTEEQKAAVEKFIQAMEAAIKARREAMKEAIDNFHSGVDNLHITRKSAIEKSLESSRLAIRSAYQNAREQCDRGVDEKTVREELKNRLREIKNQTKTERMDAKKISDDMKLLVAAKRSAFDVALSNFRTAVRNATEELKKSLPEASI